MTRILVAGFEPNDDGLNASQIVVQSLEREPAEKQLRAKAQFCWIVLPGDTNSLKTELYSRFHDFSPHACLLVGQAAGRSKVTLERIATNIRDFRVADRIGNIETGSRVVEDGPPAYLTNADIAAIIEELWRRDIPAAPSNYAGNHLCNQALYLALHYAHTDANSHMVAAFMHVPMLPEQVCERWADEPTMPLSMLREAVVTAALVLSRTA